VLCLIAVVGGGCCVVWRWSVVFGVACVGVACVGVACVGGVLMLC
jgi:hypothetical protein